MARHKILTEEEVSEWIRVPVKTLETHRYRPPKNRRPLPYLKLPNGKIGYREDQVNEWLEEQSRIAEVTPTRGKRAG